MSFSSISSSKLTTRTSRSKEQSCGTVGSIMFFFFFSSGLTNPEEKQKKNIIEPTVPQLCSFDLDVRVVNLLEEMARKRHPRTQTLFNEYMALKQELGRRPTYPRLPFEGWVPLIYL